MRTIHCELCNQKGVATSEVHRAMTNAEITHGSFMSTSKVTRGTSGQHPQKFLFGELFLPGFSSEKTSAKSTSRCERSTRPMFSHVGLPRIFMQRSSRE